MAPTNSGTHGAAHGDVAGAAGGAGKIGRGEVTGAILCGGDGRRMGGADKPLLPLRGVPMVAHVAQRLASQVRDVVLVANRSEDAYAALGLRVLRDATPGLGPLGGIAAALAASDAPLLFVCPGDAPLLASGLVARLAAALGPDDLAAYPHDGTRAQPLFLLLRRGAALPALERYLTSGRRAAQGFVETLGARAVDARDVAASFRNVNTPEELEALALES
ncbi:MAG: molybdenum cofactor guanylyltransferase [Gemmatimonadetes bacterium]|nr:molybdenum cofactor guanylyltransferase [Gemmatimonadota bacterium]